MEFRKHSTILKLLTASLMAVSSAAYAEPSQEILLEITQSQNFEVMYHRTSSSATGAVIGGLIGAAIEGGIEANGDEKKRKKIEKHINEPSCLKGLVESLRTKLEMKGFAIVDGTSMSGKAKKKMLTLHVKVQKCGFKKTDTSINTVSSFVRAKLYLKQGSKKIDDLGKTMYVLGKNQYSFESLLDSADNAQNELTSVLKRAGNKIANKLIYRKK